MSNLTDNDKLVLKFVVKQKISRNEIQARIFVSWGNSFGKKNRHELLSKTTVENSLRKLVRHDLIDTEFWDQRHMRVYFKKKK